MYIITKNKKGLFNFTSSNGYEAGICLFGSEVRSLRNNNVSIAESRVWIRDNEAWLIGANIPVPKGINPRYQHNVDRSRKLLLHRREINRIMGAIRKDNIFILPSMLYSNAAGLIKVRILTGTYGNKADKREAIRNKEWKREKSSIINY